MARDIDTSDLGKLSQEDLLYLRDRGRLTASEEADFIDDSIEDNEEEDDKPYSEMTLKELGDEIDRRNEGIDEEDQIAKPKTKGDRIAVLEEDDAALEAEGED